MDNPEKKDQVVDSQPLPSNNTTSSSTKISPVKDLIVESWNLMLKKALKSFYLWLIYMASILSFMIAAILLFVLLVVGFNVGSGSVVINLVAGLLGVVGIGGYVAIILAMTAAWILVLDDKTEEASTFSYFKKGFSFALPLFLVGILTFAIIFGGFIVFIIPGILAGIFLTFTIYTVVLDGKKWMEAAKMSAGIMAQNFGKIFGRILLLWVAYIAIQAILQSLLKSSPSFYTMALMMIVGVVFTLYSAAYSLLLYKQSRSVYDEKKPTSIKWMMIFAAIGWISFGLIIYGVAKSGAASEFSDSFQKTFEQEISKKIFEPEISSTNGGKMMPKGELNYNLLLDSINQKRIAENLPAIELDSQLCAYSSRRVKQIEDFGKYDDNAGFLSDGQDQTIWTTFFQGYANINTLVLDRIASKNEEADVAEYLASATGENKSLTSDKYDAYCARANDNYIVFVMGKKK